MVEANVEQIPVCVREGSELLSAFALRHDAHIDQLVARPDWLNQTGMAKRPRRRRV